MKKPIGHAQIALSFDVEEFDLPAEHGVRLPLEKQLEVSSEGLILILDTLEGLAVKATFFCTATFAINRPELVKKIVNQGHELASHSYYHSKFDPDDLLQSRLKLEEIAGVKVLGYRAPRMAQTSTEQLLQAGYTWDSSLNPCFIPGRYNNFSAPRKPYREACGLIEIPTSVSPLMRLPLFWLALHNLPLGLYKWLCFRAASSTGLLNIYFHPWEFSSVLHNSDYRVPSYIIRNSGKRLMNRLSTVICHFRDHGAQFVTLSQVAHRCAEQSKV